MAGIKLIHDADPLTRYKFLGNGEWDKMQVN